MTRCMARRNIVLMTITYTCLLILFKYLSGTVCNIFALKKHPDRLVNGKIYFWILLSYSHKLLISHITSPMGKSSWTIQMFSHIRVKTKSQKRYIKQLSMRERVFSSVISSDILTRNLDRSFLFCCDEDNVPVPVWLRTGKYDGFFTSDVSSEIKTYHILLPAHLRQVPDDKGSGWGSG